MKKLLAFLLLTAMLLSLTACPSAGPGGPGTGGVEGEIEYLDSIGERDFGGEEVVFSTMGSYAYEIFYEEEEPDVCDEELYKRNARLEDRFNVVITPMYQEGQGADAHTAGVRNSVMNGDDSFDISMVQIWQTGPLILDGWFYDLREWVPYVKDSINNGAAWWSADINNAYTIYGHQYVGVSDLNLSAIKTTWCYLFNKQMVEDENIATTLGYESMYEYVKAGKWTLENVYTLIKDRYEDNTTSGTGIGLRDDSDAYGILAGGSWWFEIQTSAAGINLITNDGELTPELTPFTSFSKVAEDIYNLATCNGYYAPTGKGALDLFSEGNALLCMTTFQGLESDVIHDSDVEFGVLPMPKANENQQKYHAGSQDAMTSIEIPTTWYSEERMERVGAVLEALSAESHRVVLPAYTELVLKHKNTRDEASIEMIEMIYEGRLYDLSQIHSQGQDQLYANGPSGNGTGLFYIMREFGKAPTTVSSWWESAQDLLEIRLGEIVEAYGSIND